MGSPYKRFQVVLFVFILDMVLNNIRPVPLSRLAVKSKPATSS